MYIAPYELSLGTAVSWLVALLLQCWQQPSLVEALAHSLIGEHSPGVPGRLPLTTWSAMLPAPFTADQTASHEHVHAALSLCLCLLHVQALL